MKVEIEPDVMMKPQMSREIDPLTDTKSMLMKMKMKIKTLMRNYFLL